MIRWLWVLALPYVVTVTNLPECPTYNGLQMWDGNCQVTPNYKRYHLPGFQDCVSSSTVQCSYLQEIADDLNRAHEAGYQVIETTGIVLDAMPGLPMEHPEKIVCHKLVGGMMYSVPCQ